MMKRWIVALALGGVLALVYTLSQQVEGWRYVVPVDVPEGDLLYIATFDGFTDEWELAEGRKSAQVVDGRLVLEVNVENDGIYAPALPRFTDFDATLSATATAGNIDNNAFGLVFRLTDPRNYYAFFVSSDGYYKLERRQDGQTQVLSTWIAHPAVEQGLGALNRVRVVGVGDTFRFYVNGTPVGLCLNPTGQSTYAGGQCLHSREGQNVAVPLADHLTDDAHPVGQIGAALVTLGRAETVAVAFDELVVFAPSSVPPAAPAPPAVNPP